MKIINITREQWGAKGVELFGEDRQQWKFICPACGFEAAVGEWRKVRAPEAAVAFSCIGRWQVGSREAFVEKSTPGPCNYAGGGFFKLNPVMIDGRKDAVFDFAGKPFTGIRHEELAK